MNFKKLEVYGFKSFADKLVVEFDDGITAIVGPNGCGKSNVADSIRWALGEQSAKTLRGSQMMDVIFSGTEKRKSLSYCEVALHFDNTSRIFHSEFDEIVISRKLYRNGESEYMINKQPQRLKDVVSLLHDSGLGRDSYSIIGQGRIDEILSAKAEDRRAIFEDAAGISKYKQIKIENERKHERIFEKLTRVSDIVAEQEKQLGPLATQAETAKKCFLLKDTLRMLEINNFLYQHDTAEVRKGVIQDKINGLSEELNLRQKEYEKANADYQKALENVSSIDQSIKELNSEHLNINVSLEKQAGEIKVLQVKIANLKEQNERLEHESVKQQADYDEHTKAVSELSALKIEKQRRITELRASTEEASSRYLAVVELLVKNEGEVEQAHRQVVDAMDRLSEIKSNMSSLKAEQHALEDRVDDYGKRIEVIKARIAEDKGRANVLELELRQTAEKRDKFASSAAEKSTLYNESILNLRTLAVQIDEATKKLYTANSRLQVLSAMQKEMSGYAYSVKQLIEDARSDKEINRRLHGVVSALIKVPSELETAMEVSLGQAIQNIVVPTEDDAKYLIEYLKTNRYGRATFLPVSVIKPRYLENQYSPFLTYKGCYGLACDLLEYDNKFDGIFKGLLGKTVIVDNLDTAVKMARDSKFGFKIVTLDGDVINPHGAMTGGSKKEKVSNFLSIERELKECETAVKTGEISLKALTEEQRRLSDGQTKLLEEIKFLTDQKHSVDILIATQKEKVEKINNTIEETRAQSFGLDAECHKVFERIADIKKDLDSVNELETLINSKKVNATSGNEQNQKQFDVLREDRDKLHAQMTDCKVELAASVAGLDAIEQDIARRKSALVGVLSSIEDNNSQRERNSATINSVDLNAVVVDDNSEAELRDRLVVVLAKLNDLDAYKKECQADFARVDEVRQSTQNQLSVLSELKLKHASELDQIDNTLSFYFERISTEYELDYEKCLEFRQADFDVSKGNQEANRIKRDLLRMGNVNMHAVQDYEELKKRYDEELSQKVDLETSIEDIKAIIKDMTKEMLTRFNKQFELIRTNFVACFRALFGGGNADLVLEESDNPLEAGIEIVAEPPGKKLQSISLLSGGERALTAIAILFAILKLKPMPFCILDEIEAALDDANAERFAKYLHNFSKRTQFIVITHRKPTMELADSLYGVTMEEKGVSKIVSVKLSDAVKSVEESVVS